MSILIDAVIIDTSALEAEQLDFMGIYSEVVTAFYDSLQQKDITLLTHPVLDGEIRKHIVSSEIVKKPRELQKTINRNKELFGLVGVVPTKVIDILEHLDLGKKLLAAYNVIYQNAVLLDYPSPQKVFDDYFAEKPPFSNTNKKSEFPDAFVIMSIKNYVKSHSDQSILVISGDNDWKTALDGIERVSFAETIEEGINTIQSAEGIMPSFYAAVDDIKKEIKWAAENECFDLKSYEPIDDIEVKDIQVVDISDYIIPLRVTKDEALIKCTASLSVDGSVMIIDDDRSVIDDESGTFLFVAYSEASFKGASAEIDCEIKLAFDADDPEVTVEVEKVKIDCRYCIELDLDQANVEWTKIWPEEDAISDMFDALEERGRH